MPIFNEFCKNKKCPEYIEWECEGYCTSCKLVGQSYDITEYPKDCLFLDEIKKFESEQDSSLAHNVSGLCVVALSRNLKLTTTLDMAITQSPCYVPFISEI